MSEPQEPVLSIDAQCVLAYLRRNCLGRQNANTAKVVGYYLDMSWRRVEKTVESLRNNGVFVASARAGDRRGLYLPASALEWKDALASFKRPAVTMIRTYNAMKRCSWQAIDELVGQGKLFQ